jgi:hypothetical protein
MLKKNKWQPYTLQLLYKRTEDYSDRFQFYRWALEPPNTLNYKYGAATTTQSKNPFGYNVLVCVVHLHGFIFLRGLGGHWETVIFPLPHSMIEGP